MSERELQTRTRFRPYPLDGAMLWFHPETGTNIRLTTPQTSSLRRTAPRAVMFGITNQCNLACDFCSRDVSRGSRWTVDSAARVLRDLARAGTLEVAFGGGEPFAFRGFVEMVEQLYETTALAMHVTTNGMLLRESSLRAMRGLFGQIRLSLYETNHWRDTGELLAASGQRWGANLLVDDSTLAALPGVLEELKARRCHDVALLSYVGSKRDLQLSVDGERRLADIISSSPVQCKMSVCWGERVSVPRLFWGADNAGDCGAGSDFVSITPDMKMQSCSFHDACFDIDSADDILKAWRTQQALLATPSSRFGCARRTASTGRASGEAAISVWQAFSGNNSGECVLVAKFETNEEAEKYLAELLPGLNNGTDELPPEWKAILKQEGIRLTGYDLSDYSETELARVGKTVLATTYAADDAFHELRALSWKRDAVWVGGGVHVHDDLHLVVAIQGNGVPLEAADGFTLADHGDVVFAMKGLSRPELSKAVQDVDAMRGGRPVAGEIFDDACSPEHFTQALKRLGSPPAIKRRLLVAFNSSERRQVEAFSKSIGDTWPHTAVGNLILLDGVDRRKRPAVLALRQGARAWLLDGEVVKVVGSFWYPRPEPTKGAKAAPVRSVDAHALEVRIRAYLPGASSLTIEPPQPSHWHSAASVSLETDSPAEALSALQKCGDEIGATTWLGVGEVDSLQMLLLRLQAELSR